MQVIITAITKSGAQYNFTVEGDTVICDRYEGDSSSLNVATQRPIGLRQGMVLDRLPNIEIGRCLLVREKDQTPIVSSPVIGVSAIGSY